MQFTLSFIANREQVILDHVDLFAWWGRRFAKRNRRDNEGDEFADAAISYGIEALKKWDAERGAQFKNFARSYVEISLRREFMSQLRGSIESGDENEGIIRRLAASEECHPDAYTIPQIDELRNLNDKTRVVAELCLAGFEKRQIAEQLGMKTKEVIFHIRVAGQLVLKYRKRFAGPSLFDGCNDALGAEDVETDDARAG